MRRSALFTVSLLTAVPLFSAGCSDLGNCDDPAKGRTTVVVGTELYYTGQAIITKSCATGCHASSAKGEMRHGAPGDLDFDVTPLAPGAPIKDASGNTVAVQVDSKALSGLRSRQRKVYDNREAIWDQVKDGLMPPSGFSMFKDLSAIVRKVISGQSSCTGQEALTTLGLHKEELRNWLACDTPVVETSSPDLPYQPVPAGSPPEEAAAGAKYYATSDSVGYQYPSCGAGSSSGTPSFSDLYRDIFAPNCKLCHYTGSVINDTLDFGTEDIAYTELLGANGMGGATSCTAMNPAPFVTPGNPDQSYLLMKVGGIPGKICGALMPAPPGVAKADADKIRAWIMAGALRTPAASSADAGAADAAVGDAGM